MLLSHLVWCSSVQRTCNALVKKFPYTDVALLLYKKFYVHCKIFCFSGTMLHNKKEQIHLCSKLKVNWKKFELSVSSSKPIIYFKRKTHKQCGMHYVMPNYTTWRILFVLQNCFEQIQHLRDYHTKGPLPRAISNHCSTIV